MNKELTQKLHNKYPAIFRDFGGDPKKTAMCFGFECGDGWYDIIDKACDDIMCLNPPPEFVAVQVKEKFGGLRFYVTVATDEIYKIIETLEDESYKVCEYCGSRENVEQRGGGWVRTLCNVCASK